MSSRSTSAPDKPGKPAAKTTAAKRTATKTRPAAAKPRSKASKAGRVSADERMRLVAEAAYFKAEKRAFAGGSALRDWIEAEAEIDALLNTRDAN